MAPEIPDPESTRDADFAALWSSDGATRSFSPSATGSGVPADLPFLFSSGQPFGPYVIVRPLGKGGMGQVYEAEELESGRRVAMKILSRGLGDDEERERFLREGRLAASLSHPHTVYVFGTTEVQGFPVIAMELAPGGTLKELVADRTPLAAAAAVDAVLQVIGGLEAAAAIGILHRDIKPSNCFVHADGRVLVGDFGLSVATSSRGASGTGRGTILGTPGFASPEQLRGDALDLRSDIYSVGATIFYLLAGRAPFEDQTTSALLTRVAGEPPPSLAVLRPDIPRRLAAVVAKCLAKTPEERYADYAALAAALEPFSSAQLKPAPAGRRLVAGWIDVSAVAIPAILLERYFRLPAVNPSYPLATVLFALAAIAVMVVYFGWFEARPGATPGKLLFGLRVVDASNHPPPLSTAMLRALVFGLPLQLIARTAAYVALANVPDTSGRRIALLAGGAALAVLFSPARRSNGFSGLHDRATATRVVLKRRLSEVRRRQDRSAADTVAAPSDGTRIGPYLVPAAATLPVETTVAIEAYDDRLGRPVWMDLLPPGTPALDARRRDLGRPGRARWLAGRRLGVECWDAYEAIEGEPVHSAAPRAQPWSRVRHWLGDLTRELTAGLDEGSLPALHYRRVWIDRNDRARLLDWSTAGAAREVSDADAEAPDLASAQRLLYVVAVSGLLGIPPETARKTKPDTPLPLPARALLLSLRDGAFQSAATLRDAVAAAVDAPAEYPASRRAAQIGVCALLPVLVPALTIGATLASGQQTLLALMGSPIAMWRTAVALALGMLLALAPFALASAFVMRGGVTLRAFGAAVVNRRGERASRFRTLWRAMLVWAPTAAIPFLIENDTSVSIDAPLVARTAFVALLVAAAVWTALHPSRSIQDRLAGTWIVPR